MNPRHVTLLVRMEVLRRVRSFLSERRRVVILAIAGVVLLVPLGGGAFAMYAAGRAVATGDPSIPRWVLRAIGGGAVGLVAITSAIRAVQTAAVPANADGLLTAAGHREVVARVVVVEVLTAWLVFGSPATVGAIAFGLGAGSVTAGAGVLVAAISAVLLGATLGLVAGFAVRNAIARSELLARYKTAIGVLLFVGYFLAITTTGEDGTNSAFAAAGAALGRTPLGWFGDLALVGTDVEVNAAFAGGAILLTAGGVVVSSALLDRLAAWLWYEEPVEGSRETSESARMGDFGGVPRPVARVAKKSWLRAWRSPIRLLYVVYPLFVLIGPVSEAIRTGTIPPYLPAVVALYGGWATGAAFTLNPLGDETDVLPVTLTSPISGRAFVAGCCLAGVALGAPLTAAGAVAAALAAGSGPATTVAMGVLGAGVPVGATLLATGIGTAFPRMEAVNVTRGRTAVVPSLIGFAVYSLALSLLAGPGLLVQFAAARRAIEDAIGVGGVGLLLGGVAASLALIGVAGLASFRWAARTFDEYYLE